MICIQSRLKNGSLASMNTVISLKNKPFYLKPCSQPYNMVLCQTCSRNSTLGSGLWVVGQTLTEPSVHEDVLQHLVNTKEESIPKKETIDLK